jgi:GTP cyclohydrolase I
VPPVGLLKKLQITSPFTAPSLIKSHSCEPADPSVPVSEAIRRRIIKAGARYHSNDNISEFVREDEMALLVEEVARQMQGVLR